ncbi:hypothetical protein HID58_092358 [Brassica napus]|uniref:Lon proteolytic domain-containing protein n=3 Tax=Brassica napus TaxID=3708 RepID=A0ABQ7WWW5_BRANA|nr:hypothetical protein HID58_092358 [Brassica napus]
MQETAQTADESLFSERFKHYNSTTDSLSIIFLFSAENIRVRIEPIKEKIPKHVLKVIEEELAKLVMLESSSSCVESTYDYLDWLTMLPWGNFSDENFDIQKAEKILDNDHYGLSHVKERILEFIAVRRLKGTSKGLINLKKICNIFLRSKQMFHSTVPWNRQYANINNKCILFLWQLGKSSSDDPGSALLELLDPEQNADFRDLYLDVTIDLSKVLFVCTANVLDKIPTPLLDRMEVINISGYITDDKMHIARDHLLKTTCMECGIKPEQVVVRDAALRSLIENYCREPGVRNLQKHIEKIYRKIALKLVREGASAETPEVSVKNFIIDESNLADYVGKPVLYADKIYEQTPVGVVMGLSTKSTGGSTLYIETTSVEEGEGKGGLHITGQLGDVMKESAEIAHTVARRIMLEKEPKNLFFANSKLHLHIPEGATPKDGPSAGCTMITSFLSLAMKKPVRKDLAMTGEVTLTGRILPIGGVKEKTIAARRSQVKMMIFPEGNRRDFDELACNLKEGLDVHFVDEYEQIFELAFGYNMGSPPLNFRRSLTSFMWDLLSGCFQ